MIAVKTSRLSYIAKVSSTCVMAMGNKDGNYKYPKPMQYRKVCFCIDPPGKQTRGLEDVDTMKPAYMEVVNRSSFPLLEFAK